MRRPFYHIAGGSEKVAGDDQADGEQTQHDVVVDTGIIGEQQRADSHDGLMEPEMRQRFGSPEKANAGIAKERSGYSRGIGYDHGDKFRRDSF